MKVAEIPKQATNLDWSQTLLTAEKHLSRGRITAAIDEYRKLVDWDPADLQVLNTLGDLYVRVGLNRQATRIFSRVAEAYRKEGFFPRAIALLKKLLRIDPTDLEAAAKLAECYQAQGLRGEAIRQYAEVADAYERAGRGIKALDVYQRVAEIDSSNPSLLTTLGERCLSEGMEQQAHTSSQVAGDEFFKQGDYEHALAANLKPQATHPDDHKTLAAIASTCAIQGRAENAVPQKYQDDARRNVLGIAGALSKRGQTEDAAALLRRALRTEPDNVEARIALKNIYASVGSLDLAANEYLQIGRIRQSGKTLVSDSREFAPAPVIPKLIPASAQIALSAASTDFELIPKANRRRVKRLSRRVPLVVIYDTGGWREFTETIDVGEEGLRIRLSHPVAPMTVLGILIDTAKWPETFSRHPSVNAQQAIVRYCKQRPGESNIVGVELWPIPEQMSNATLSFEQFTDCLSAVSM